MTDKNREKHRHAVEVLANDFVAGGWHNEYQYEADSFDSFFGDLSKDVQDEIEEKIDEIVRRLEPGNANVIAANEFLEDEQ